MSDPAKPAMPSARSYLSGARLALAGVMVNAFLGIIKILAGLLGNTYALIADGVESLLDIFGSLAVWFGLRVAAAPPDDEHPYGHGKAEVLSAILVSFTVVAAAIGLAVQSIREIRTPHGLPATWTLIVLVGVVIVKELLARKVGRAGVLIGSTAVKSDAWHHRSDAITSALAFVGIVIARITDYAAADDWAALFASGLIAWNGVLLLRLLLLRIQPLQRLRALVDVLEVGAHLLYRAWVAPGCRARSPRPGSMPTRDRGSRHRYRC